MKPYDRLRQDIVEALERFEETQRRYTAKVEEDRPWVAEAHWHAVWRFRKRTSESLDVLKEQLHQARFVKDPG